MLFTWLGIQCANQTSDDELGFDGDEIERIFEDVSEDFYLISRNTRLTAP